MYRDPTNRELKPELTSNQASNRVSDEAKKAIDVVAKFVLEECIPFVLTPFQ